MDVIVLHKWSEGVPLTVTPEHLEIIRAHAEHVYMFETEEELLASGADGDVLFTWGGSGMQAERFCLGSKKLKWFSSFSAGMDPVMNSRIREKDIYITNAAGIHGKTMGVTAIGYIISHMRRFQAISANQREHRWSHDFGRFEPSEPEGHTLGIVGAGAIGSQTAAYAKALNFRVIGVRRKSVTMENFDAMYTNEQLDEALGQMDYCVVVLPHTKETTGFFDYRHLHALKKGAFLVNIGRGKVVETDALIRVLREGHLSGCALDALDPEPLNADSPLWDMEDVFISPHCSAVSPLYMDRAVNQFADNLRRFKSGDKLINIVTA